MRLVSGLPVDGPGALAWQPWARFEAYLDIAMAERPLWQLCLYDRRTAGDLAIAHAPDPLLVGRADQLDRDELARPHATPPLPRQVEASESAPAA